MKRLYPRDDGRTAEFGSIDVAPNGVVAAGGPDVYLIDSENGSVIDIIAQKDETAQRVLFSDDGRRLCVASESEVAIYDVKM